MQHDSKDDINTLIDLIEKAANANESDRPKQMHALGIFLGKKPGILNEKVTRPPNTYNSPLLFAVINRYFSVVPILLQYGNVYGAPVDRDYEIGASALDWLIHMSNTSNSNEEQVGALVQELIKFKATVREELIEVANRNGMSKIAGGLAQYVLSKKAEEFKSSELSDEEKAFRHAIEKRDMKVIKEMFSRGFPYDYMPSGQDVLAFAENTLKYGEVVDYIALINRAATSAAFPTSRDLSAFNARVKHNKEIYDYKNREGKSLIDLLENAADVPAKETMLKKLGIEKSEPTINPEWEERNKDILAILRGDEKKSPYQQLAKFGSWAAPKASSTTDMPPPPARPPRNKDR